METDPQRSTREEAPTDAERHAARNHAGGYLYRIDPDCDPHGRVPPEKIQGAWKVDAAGNIVGRFQRNPKCLGAAHRP